MSPTTKTTTSTAAQHIGSKFQTTSKKYMTRKMGLVYVSALSMVLILSHEASIANCEAKEFDWSDLGVQLANSKPSLAGSSAASNLRILVSPQRRMTKNYEFEYTNSSQTNSGPSDASYVMSSANGSPYLSQSVYQLSPNHSGHPSAYSALSASLASLKSRLNARGVTLSSTLGENGSQPISHLYSTQNAYGSSVLMDPSQQQVQQQQQQQQLQLPQQQLVQSQVAPQSSYLSVSSQQDQQQSSAYTVPPSQSNEGNKTIVLAIPAKINFLTGSKHQSQQQQQQQQQQTQLHQTQQAQQLSVLQSAVGDQSQRPEYVQRQQMGVLAGPEAGLEAHGQPGVEQQEHHQYVIVNQQPMSGDQHSHSVAASLNPTQVSSAGQIYSTVYQSSPATGYTLKYMPAYTQQSQYQPQTVQKVYSVLEPQPLIASQAIASPLPQVQTSFEPQVVETPSMMTRYTTCLDTCNSADPRWRKYTVSKYKACCSRSAQFDPSFEQPSAEKVGESSTRYNEDAYYNYLYRKTRARRSRRQRQGRYSTSSSNGRYPASSTSSSAQQADEEPQIIEPSSAEGGRPVSSTGRSAYYNQEYPYMKSQYRASRGYGGASSTASASGQEVSQEQTEQQTPNGGGKYVTKERAYRRGRSRELEPMGEPQPLNENAEDESIYPPRSHPTLSSSYGSGEFSVDSQGRGYSSESGRGSASGDEEDQTRYDESTDLEPAGKQTGEVTEYSGEPSDANEEGELDGSNPGSSYKYPTNNRRKKSQSKSMRQQRKPLGAQAKEQSGKFYKNKARKNKYGKSSGDHAVSANGTDYESAQPGEYNQEQTNNGDHEEHQSGYATKDSSQLNGSAYDSQSESDKDSSSGNKYRANLNDTTVANLSKTTMHLKEILSILEKKAHLSRNESSVSTAAAAQSQQPTIQPQSLPVTSTPTPIITTTLYPPFSPLFSGSQFSSPLSSDFLSADFGLKSPYRFDPSTLASSLSSSALSLPSSFGSFGSSDTFSPLTPPYPSQYGMHSQKHLGNPNGHQRKRRPSKSTRYNDLMFQKAAHSLANQPSLLHAAAKNRLLNPAYYSSMQYPYLYRGSSPSITNPYPYKNLNKNPYSSLLNGPVSSKLASASSGQLYSDESRLHGLTSLDPLANMGSSLRPTASMRLGRNKPFMFQPHVLPIYTRHTILAPQMEVKA